MVEAAPLFRPGKQPTLIERGNWDGVIVEIDPGKLEFSTTPILAEGLNLWPGGEWEPNVPVIRFGPRSNINKIEVWALTAGSSLYVIDGRSRVVHLSAAMGCGAHLHVVTYQRLAEYIARRCAEATEVRAVEWAYRNLNALARRYPSLQREAELAENKYHRLRKFT